MDFTGGWYRPNQTQASGHWIVVLKSTTVPFLVCCETNKIWKKENEDLKGSTLWSSFQVAGSQTQTSQPASSLKITFHLKKQGATNINKRHLMFYFIAMVWMIVWRMLASAKKNQQHSVLKRISLVSKDQLYYFHLLLFTSLCTFGHKFFAITFVS